MQIYVGQSHLKKGYITFTTTSTSVFGIGPIITIPKGSGQPKGRSTSTYFLPFSLPAISIPRSNIRHNGNIHQILSYLDVSSQIHLSFAKNKHIYRPSLYMTRNFTSSHSLRACDGETTVSERFSMANRSVIVTGGARGMALQSARQLRRWEATVHA